MSRTRLGANHLSWLADRIINSHANITTAGDRRHLLQIVPVYLREYDDLHHALAEIHNDIYEVIKKNKMTFEEIRGEKLK